jgi:hypothetical protein
MYHVLDVMEGIHDASRAGKCYATRSPCERPAALPQGLADGEVR